jgi:hypothetical protein
MDIGAAQAESRKSFVEGGPGAIVSGLVWLASAFVEQRFGVAPAFAVLFFGGTLIFPLTLFIVRGVLRRPPLSRENSLKNLALESAIGMTAGLLAAYLFIRPLPTLVFPIAAVAVGAHYFVFRTMYGQRLFWLRGAVITAIGLFAIFGPVDLPGGTLFPVAGVELLFAALVTAKMLAGPARGG